MAIKSQQELFEAYIDSEDFVNDCRQMAEDMLTDDASLIESTFSDYSWDVLDYSNLFKEPDNFVQDAREMCIEYWAESDQVIKEVVNKWHEYDQEMRETFH